MINRPRPDQAGRRQIAALVLDRASAGARLLLAIRRRLIDAERAAQSFLATVPKDVAVGVIVRVAPAAGSIT